MTVKISINDVSDLGFDTMHNQLINKEVDIDASRTNKNEPGQYKTLFVCTSSAV